MAILEMNNISKSFSGVYANEKVDLAVEKGEIHALLGENGAGKTTLMNILFGIYEADQGEVLWKGKQVQFTSPKEAIDQGIGMVHQHFSLIPKMTVLDNIILGRKEEGVFLNRKEAAFRVEELAEKYGLQVEPEAKAGALSVGQQQRVEILKTLYREAELLILDEPTGVLTPAETEQFFSVLRKLKEEGHSIIIITHRMSEIMSISDRVTILRDGKKVRDLVTAETSPEELSYYMIGRKTEEVSERRERPGRGKECLKLSKVCISRNTRKPLLDNISMEVAEGEILGIAGVDGNGQKELAEVIAGIRRCTSGCITFYGENITGKKIKERFVRGISYISDDRHNDSLVLDMTLEENMILREYGREPYSRAGFFLRNAIKKAAEKAMAEYRIKTSGKAGSEAKVRLLSGGNQQKIVLAREITERAKLILASQPTRGLDIGASEFVHKVLMEQRNQGKSIILISADLEEIMQLSDRVAVMFGGKIAGILEKDEITQEKLGLLMGGITGEEK